MKMPAFHVGKGHAFPAAKHAYGPGGAPIGAAPPLPTNPAVAAPMPPSASPPSPGAGGGGGLQGLMAEATQAAGG